MKKLSSRLTGLLPMTYLSAITITKISIVIVLIAVANTVSRAPLHGAIAVTELLMVYFFALVCGYRLRWLSYVATSMMTLLILAQELVLVYAGTYTTKVMLDNLANIHALGTALNKYVALLILVLIVSFLPIKFKRYPRATWRLALIIISLIFWGGVIGTHHSTAILAVRDLANEYQAAAKNAQQLEASRQARKRIVASFKKTKIGNGIDIGLKHPNVIVIFAEGTSRSVIDSNNTQYPNLMPNVNQFSRESLDFIHYYNHTAATYKGLRGQLFSSFQYYEGFEGTKNANQIKRRLDTPLVGLPQILHDCGYSSTFINPEPKHKQFTPYLNQLGFDQVISGDERLWTGSGESTFVSDKENLSLLYQQATEMNSKKKPFFLSTYTLQTHNSWNALDNPYGDGKNAVLNKFHNFDVVFGEFLRQFKASGLAKNTILILTTDHASYPSPDYTGTMSDNRSEFVSTIPLMIYYPGVKTQVIDANGRNSLDLTPTILDLLNIKNENNYFLGTSLFTNHPSEYEFTTHISQEFYSTQENTVRAFSDNDSRLKNKIIQFDTFALNLD